MGSSHRARVCTTFRANMALKMQGFVFIYLSAACLSCVSAGGRYCASPRARAASLGLNFPGVHDLSGPPPYYAQHPRVPYHQLYQSNHHPSATGTNMLHNLPKEIPHFLPAGYDRLVPTNPQRGLSGDEPLNNRQANFVQVKRVVSPLTRFPPSGQADFEYGASESQANKVEFAFNRRSPGVEAAVPIRHGVSEMSGRSPPFSPGFYFIPHPRGDVSKHDIINSAMGPRGNWRRGHFPRPMYRRINNKPRNPF